MARIKIDLPEKFTFKTEVTIRIGDINYGGHVGNDVILSLIHEARMQFFKSHGYTELDMAGTGSILADSAIVYKGESFHADVLIIEVAAGDFHKYGFDLFYKISNKETGKSIAEAKTGIVCFNYSTRKIAALPQEVKEKIEL